MTFDLDFLSYFSMWDLVRKQVCEKYRPTLATVRCYKHGELVFSTL